MIWRDRGCLTIPESPRSAGEEDEVTSCTVLNPRQEEFGLSPVGTGVGRREKDAGLSR